MEQSATSAEPTALQRLRGWWDKVAGAIGIAPGEPEPDRATARVLDQIRELLDDFRAQRGGELSGRRRAEQMMAICRDADQAQCTAILKLISREFSPDRAELDAAISDLQRAMTETDLGRAEARLRRALSAPRAYFFTQFNLVPEGVKFLVGLRADVNRALPDEPALEVLKVELDALIEAWFDPGFLDLRRISWQTPALVLEKLIAYEAVHPITSWEDLRNRLDRDRRCYAFFHPRMPDEPLIFVEIALVKGFPESVQALLDLNDPARNPRETDTAVFYSISNTQKGLQGISFGNLLLKRVIEDLRQDLPQLKNFATLSPLPGFRRWLDRMLKENGGLISESEASKIAKAAPGIPTENALESALAREGWQADENLAETLHGPMEKLCARYLLKEKSGARPIDPVAAFHLNNGARVNRILWLADTSARGLKQSYGMMVSYLYDLGHVDDNHERFAKSGEIAAARGVRRLAD